MKKPKGKTVLIILGIVALLVTIAFLARPAINKFAEEKILEIIDSSPGIAKYVECDSLQAECFEGRLEFHKVTLHIPSPDSSAKKIGTIIKVATKTIKVEGIDWFPLLFNQKLSANSFTFFSPEIISSPATQQDSALFVGNDTPGGKKKIPAEIGRFVIENATYKHFRKSEDKTPLLKIDTLSSSLEHVSFQPGKKRPLDVETVDFKLSGITINDKKALHFFQVINVNGNSKDSLIMMENLAVIPKYSRSEMPKHTAVKETWMDVKFRKVSLEGCDVLALIDKRLQAGHIKVEEPNFNIFDNANLPHKEKRVPFIQELLLAAPISIEVDSMSVKRGFITFDLMAKGSEKTGSIDFTNAYASFYNVVNTKERMEKDPQLKIAVLADLENKTKVHLKFDMNLEEKDLPFSYSGRTSSFDLTLFNEMLGPTSKFRFSDGRATHLSFDVEANKYKAEGTMRFNYEDMEIDVLGKDHEEKGILSFLFSTFILSNNNKSGDENAEKGSIYWERVYNRSFFHFWWQSLLTGFKSVLLPNIALREKLESAEAKPGKKKKKKK